MVREILIWPHPVLASVCAPVTDFSDDLRRLLMDLTETMLAAKGSGLAAPQLGYPLRAVAVLVEDPHGIRSVLGIVNPRIIERRGSQLMKEGCLSLPGIVDQVRRATWVRVEGQDGEGRKLEVEGDGLLAHALQHELEHLDGTVFVEHLSFIKRNLARRKLEKAKQRGMRYNAERPVPQDFTAGT